MNLAELFTASLEDIDSGIDTLIAEGVVDATTGEEAPVELNPEVIEEANEAVIEVDGAHEELVAESAKSEKIEELAQDLEYQVNIATEALASDAGISLEAFQNYQNRVANIYKQVGAQFPSSPSLEGLDADAIKEKAKAFVADGGAKLKAFWEALVRQLAAAFKYFKDFIAKLFDAAERIKKRAAGVIVSARSIEGEAKGKVTISGAKLITFKGKADLASAVAGLKATAKTYEAVADGMISSYTSAVGAIGGADAEAALAKFEKISVAGGAIIGGIKVSVVDGAVVSSGDGFDNDGDKTIEIAAGSKNEIIEAAKAVIGFVNAVSATKKDIDALGEKKMSLLEKIKATVKNNEQQTALKKFHSSVDAIQAKRERALASILKAGLKGANAALSLAEKSIKAYK